MMLRFQANFLNVIIALSYTTVHLPDQHRDLYHPSSKIFMAPWQLCKVKLLSCRYINCEYELSDLSVNEMFTKPKIILFPLIGLYVPVVSPRPIHKVSSPPNALKSLRKNAQQSYISRSTYGRHSQHALLALKQYNDINYRFWIFYDLSQIDYKKSLTTKIEISLKCLHHYIKSKKVGALSVGPLCKDDGDLTAECGEMAELLATEFCSVYALHELHSPFPHQ